MDGPGSRRESCTPDRQRTRLWRCCTTAPWDCCTSGATRTRTSGLPSPVLTSPGFRRSKALFVFGCVHPGLRPSQRIQRNRRIDAHSRVHQLILCLLQVTPCAIDVDLFGPNRGIGQYADVVRQHLDEPTLNRQVPLLTSAAVAEEPGTELAEQRSM